MNADTQERVFSSEDELDLSGEGLQPTRVDLLISKAEIQPERPDGSQRWHVEMEPQEEVEGLTRKTVTDSGFIKHPASAGQDTDLARIGKGALKRLGKTVLGKDKFVITELVGQRVNAEIKETDDGFVRVGKYRRLGE